MEQEQCSSYFLIIISLKEITIKIRKQAGAELCQAQLQVDLLADFSLQMNFRFGQHWKK
jgi:hypothetical protein